MFSRPSVSSANGSLIGWANFSRSHWIFICAFLHQTEAPTWYLQYWQLFLVLMLISQSLLPLQTKDLFLAFWKNQGLIDSCAIHIFLPNL